MSEEHQVDNNGGGQSNVLSPFARYKRFLLLGSFGTCYISTEEMTQQNLDNVIDLWVHHEELRDAILEELATIAKQRRAPKQEPAIATLACISAKDKTHLFNLLPVVCPTLSHLMLFLSYCKMLSPIGKVSWGRCMRKAISAWILARDPQQLLYQVTKYRNRSGFTFKDILRLAHTKTASPDMGAVFQYMLHGTITGDAVSNVELLRTSHDMDIVLEKINELSWVTWEHIGKQKHLKEPAIWQALIQKGNLPSLAFLRNIGRMTSIGVDKYMIQDYIIHHIIEPNVQKRPHPIQILQTYIMYKKGGVDWKADMHTYMLLEQAFYASIIHHTPIKKRLFVALDVSGSMCGTQCVGMPHMTAMDAEVAMAMSLLKSTEEHMIVKMFSNTLSDAPIDKDMTLDQVYDALSGMPFASTDCSLPIQYALDHELVIDAFVVMTDSETNCNREPPHIVLERYRNAINPQAKLIVMAFSSTQFTIADPNDPGMLDIAGVDSACWDVVKLFLDT